MIISQKPLTAADLLDLPDDGRRYELVKGELIEMPPPGIMHTITTGQIAWLFGSFIRQNNLPFVDGPEAAAYIERSPDTIRAADYAIIALDRIPRPIPDSGYVFGVVPDLVVEVVSPGYRASEIADRSRMWLDAGVRLVLAAYIATREVVAHYADGSTRGFGMDDTLTCEPVLPGFSCRISDIFPPRPE